MGKLDKEAAFYAVGASTDPMKQRVWLNMQALAPLLAVAFFSGATAQPDFRLLGILTVLGLVIFAVAPAWSLWAVKTQVRPSALSEAAVRQWESLQVEYRVGVPLSVIGHGSVNALAVGTGESGVAALTQEALDLDDASRLLLLRAVAVQLSGGFGPVLTRVSAVSWYSVLAVAGMIPVFLWEGSWEAVGVCFVVAVAMIAWADTVTGRVKALVDSAAGEPQAVAGLIEQVVRAGAPQARIPALSGALWFALRTLEDRVAERRARYGAITRRRLRSLHGRAEAKADEA